MSKNQLEEKNGMVESFNEQVKYLLLVTGAEEKGNKQEVERFKKEAAQKGYKM